MKNIKTIIIGMVSALTLTGCSTDDVPAAHKGYMFEKTGVAALYQGKTGFTGQVLDPGTYYTGIYGQVKLLECKEETVKESLESLTKDGVKFTVDSYVRYQPNCSSKAADWIFKNVNTTKMIDGQALIEARTLYLTYVSPVIHNAMREAVSKHNASDMNDKRSEISIEFDNRYTARLKENTNMPVDVKEINMSNFKFPESMEKTNAELAQQATLTKLALANRDRIEQEIKTEQTKVTADTQTQKLKVLQEKEWAETQTQSIKIIAKAIRDNPEYMKYDFQQKLPEITKNLGQNGNLIIMDSRAGMGNFLMNLGAMRDSK